jgi:hypothetical protein
MNLLHCLAVLVLLPRACPLLAQKMLRVTPSTVQWGRFDAAAKPVLTVKPGEVVTIDTICGVPEMLERLGAATDEPIREMKQMYAEIKDRGSGPHFLTGPVAIEGSMPGDVLEVEILEIRLRSPDRSITASALEIVLTYLQFMQSEIVRKLNAEMVLDIESERQVVYILAQISKLIELGSFAKGE